MLVGLDFQTLYTTYTFSKNTIPLETGVKTSLDRSKKNGNQQATDTQTAAIFSVHLGSAFFTRANDSPGNASRGQS